MKQEELIKLFNKYGFQSLKKEPFLYVNGLDIGIAYSIKMPYYGELKRIYIPKDREDAEDFLAKYSWYKRVGKKSSVSIDLPYYNKKITDIIYKLETKELKKDELQNINPEVKKRSNPTKENLYLKKIKRTFLILLEVMEEKIRIQKVTYQNLIKLTNEHNEKQNYWNEIIKDKKNLTVEKIKKLAAESDDVTYKDTVESWKIEINELKEKDLLEKYIKELVDFIQSLEIAEGFLKNKYQLIKLPLETNTLKEKIEAIEKEKNNKKGLFSKKQDFEKIIKEIEDKNSIHQIVSYEHYKENEINRIMEKYKIIPDLDIRTIGDFFIEFDNLKIEEPKIEDENQIENKKLTYEETMKELENEFYKKKKEDQELLIAYSYISKNVLSENIEDQKNNVEEFINTLSNPNNIMIKVKYFKNINLTSNTACLKSIIKMEEKIKTLQTQKVKGNINVFWKSNRKMEKRIKASTKRILAPCQNAGENDITYIGKLKENCEVLFIPSELKKNYLLGDTLVLEKNCPLFIIDFQKNVRKDENAVIIKVMNYEFKKKIKKITLVSDLEQETVTLYKTTVIERIEE